MLRALALVVLAGCSGGRATRAECTEMLDKYLEMTKTPHEEPSARRPPAYERALARCQAEVTKREQRCAMKTFTPEAWQACID